MFCALTNSYWDFSCSGITMEANGLHIIQVRRVHLKILECSLPWNSFGWCRSFPSWGAAPFLSGPQVSVVVRGGREIFLIKIQVEVGCHIIMKPLILRNLLSFNCVSSLYIHTIKTCQNTIICNLPQLWQSFLLLAVLDQAPHQCQSEPP